MVEQKVDGDFSTPYRFTGKEEDVETGLYYYGARYYDPKLSIWMSVDPLAGKYPAWSPYNYTMNNPIKFIDPDGRDVDEADYIYKQQADGSFQKVEGIENDGGEFIHMFMTNDGTNIFVDVKAGKSVYICQDDINEQIAIALQPKIRQFGITVSIAENGVGVMGAAGYAWDTEGNTGWYTTVGVVVGFGSSVGFEYTQSTSTVRDPNFSVKAVDGFSYNTNASAWYLNAAFGGNASNMSDMLNHESSSYNSKTFGVSLRPGAGLSNSYEYTKFYPNK